VLFLPVAETHCPHPLASAREAIATNLLLVGKELCCSIIKRRRRRIFIINFTTINPCVLRPLGL
jgi:hypothetical protein